jgi:Organic solute transporter Ostalpha
MADPLTAVICLAFLFAGVAVALGVRHIYLHLRCYTRPEYQLHIVRILAMVPLYSVTAWAALVVTSPRTLLWLAVVRDSYEAYVIYNFLVLLINYGGGDRQLSYFLEGQPRLPHTFPVSLWLPPIQLGPSFINFVRACCLQFVFVKPAGAFLKLRLYNAELETPGSRYASLHIILSIAENVSVSTALYGLILFYHAAEQLLRPHRPLPKFLAVKAIVFFSFWQGIVLNILVHLNFIKDIDGFTAHEQATGLQDFLICLEMAIAACAHYYVFSYTEYASDDCAPPPNHFSSAHPLLRNFGDIVDFRDVLSDAKERLSGGHTFESELRDSEPLLPGVDRVLGALTPRALSARNSHGSASSLSFDLAKAPWNVRNNHISNSSNMAADYDSFEYESNFHCVGYNAIDFDDNASFDLESPPASDHPPEGHRRVRSLDTSPVKLRRHLQ